VPDQTRSEQVLASVLSSLSAWGRTEFRTEVQKSWTEGDAILCIVYRQPDMYPTLRLGLRRTIEADWTVAGIADEIVSCEIGEPLGSLYDTLQPDAEGVMWWTGNLPEWRVRR
jgi:hypothetical protein